MNKVGPVFERIFKPDLKYEEYAKQNAMFGREVVRLVTQDEYDDLRRLAGIARGNTQITYVLPTCNPRYHVATARRVFADMRSAHDRLYNTLDALLAWSNGHAAAQAQGRLTRKDSVLDRAKMQMETLEEIKALRAKQRENLANATRAAQEVANKHIRDPFRVPSQDKKEPLYYEQHAEMIRYNDLLNQANSLDIADTYDRMTTTGLEAEKQRDLLEFELAGLSMSNLDDRRVLLGFDFTARVVDAMRDVFQNAFEVVSVFTTLWGLDRLEQVSPNYRSGDRQGWYFGLASSLWPAWAGQQTIDAVAKTLFGDGLLSYLDEADAYLSRAETKLQEFETNRTRSLFTTKLNFTKVGNDLQATLTMPAYYRYQEIDAVYLKKVPPDVQAVVARVKDARVSVYAGAQHMQCDAVLEDSRFGVMTIGSDGGMAGEEPIFALEKDCLTTASAGNQSITLTCRSASTAFTVDCIVRLSGFMSAVA